MLRVVKIKNNYVSMVIVLLVYRNVLSDKHKSFLFKQMGLHIHLNLAIVIVRVTCEHLCFLNNTISQGWPDFFALGPNLNIIFLLGPNLSKSVTISSKQKFLKSF